MRFSDLDANTAKMICDDRSKRWEDNIEKWALSSNKIKAYLNGKTKRLDFEDLRNIVTAYESLNDYMLGSLAFAKATHYEFITKRNTPWTKEEEELAIEMKTNEEEYNPIAMAMLLKRSPGTILTKISQLVGQERKSKPVDGIFKGVMKTTESGETDISGRVWKRA